MPSPPKLSAAQAIRKALPYFVGGFLLFFTVGFVRGWNHRTDSAQQEIYRNLTVGNRSGAYLLMHQCAGALTHTFFVENNGLDSEPLAVLQQRSTALLGGASPEHLEYREFLLTFAGGASGGLTWRDLAKKSSTKGVPRALAIGRIVAGIVGGISGYTLGEWSGARFDVDCSSTLAMKLLSDSKEWQNREGYWLLGGALEIQFVKRPAVIGDPMRHPEPLKEDPVFLCETSLFREIVGLRERLSRQDVDPGDAEFRALYAAKGRYDDIVRSPEYALIERLKVYREAKRRGAEPALLKSGGYTDDAWDKACEALEAG